ncbi:MAG: hypothetical protein LUE27_09410 [Clostridia bacterium]|nr:hypothetical protein [Clostridia bacterium]
MNDFKVNPYSGSVYSAIELVSMAWIDKKVQIPWKYGGFQWKSLLWVYISWHEAIFLSRIAYKDPKSLEVWWILMEILALGEYFLPWSLFFW